MRRMEEERKKTRKRERGQNEQHKPRKHRDKNEQICKFGTEERTYMLRIRRSGIATWLPINLYIYIVLYLAKTHTNPLFTA